MLKTAVVTGISSGIGRATALGLGALGYAVIGAGRSELRTQPVIDEIVSSGGAAEFLQMDLASLASVHEAAERLRDRDRPIDVLVANAGVGGVRGVTSDGFEIHFGVNHLGHFALVGGVIPALADQARVVVVSSEAHRRAETIDYDRLRSPSGWLGVFHAYGVSKLANILFARSLAERAPHLKTYAVHPGVVDTNIFPTFVKPFVRNRRTPEQGAETSIWCATSPDLADETGRYYAYKKERRPSDPALDDRLAAELWLRSEEWSGR